MRSKHLRDLASRVRAGEVIDWGIECQAMALEQAAQDAEFIEQIAEQRSRELSKFSGIGIGGSTTDPNDGGEIA